MIRIKATLSIIPIFISTLAFSQQKDSASMEHYLQKSRIEKKNSYIIAGTGVAIIGAFYIADGINNDLDADWKPFIITASVLLASAYALRVASIINHKKALRLSAHFIKSNLPLRNQTGLFTHSYPALTLKIPL